MMANGGRLVSANLLLDWIDNIESLNNIRLSEGMKAKALNCELVRNMVNKLPTVDGVPVVRCAVCEYGWRYFNPFDGKEYINCAKYPGKPFVAADHFCAYGKKREGA